MSLFFLGESMIWSVKAIRGNAMLSLWTPLASLREANCRVIG